MFISSEHLLNFIKGDLSDERMGRFIESVAENGLDGQGDEWGQLGKKPAKRQKKGKK